MTVKRFILIRPGETDWNRQGSWQGWAAVPINDHGRRQAQRLARFIRNLGIKALYSSDLRRAHETAELLTAHLDFDPIYDERLRERNIGHWQGMNLSQIRDWYPEAYDELIAHPETFAVPGGESRQYVVERAKEALSDILRDASVDTVGVVTHTTVIRGLVGAMARNCNPNDMVFTNSSVTTLERNGEPDEDGKFWRVVICNDVSHLDGLETQSVGELDQ